MKVLSAIFFMSICFAQTEEPNPGPRSPGQAEFLFSEASKSEKNGKVDLAIQDYQKLLQGYPAFARKFDVYQSLITLYLTQKKPQTVLALAKEALHMMPPRNVSANLQILRMEAELQLGKPNDARLIAEELLRTKPEPKVESTALLYKAETLSQLGKHKEALASLDAVKNNEKFSDAQLKIQARNCSSKKPKSGEALLDYFHLKNLCFKEGAALAKSSPAKDASQVWCDRFHDLETELKKSKLDQFTVDKLKKEFDESKALAGTWGCS